MADKQEAAAHKPYSTSPQVNPYGRVDEEVPYVAQREEKRKKRVKCLAYLAAFIVFQTIIFLILGLTIMRVRSPKFRVMSATFDRFDVVTQDTNPSFNIRMMAQFGLKNNNFGRYKYQNSTIEFFYRGTQVGQAVVLRSRAGARSTRRFLVTIDLSSANVPAEVLANDFRTGGVIRLASQSKLRGKVEIMKIMKKNKGSNMNCTMEINISSRQLGNISCK